MIQVNLGERRCLSKIHESCSLSDFGLNFRQEVPHLEITSSYCHPKLPVTWLGIS